MATCGAIVVIVCLYIYPTKRLPSRFDWREVRGSDNALSRGQKCLFEGSFVSRVLNQHQTKWCGCCYLLSVIQCLQDRLNVHDHCTSTKTRTEFELQVIMDEYDRITSSGMSWNACLGGQPSDVIGCLERRELPLVPGDSMRDWSGYPREVVGPKDDYENDCRHAIRVESIDTSSFSYPDDIQGEIWQHGPVVLNINATNLLQLNADGIVENEIDIRRANHAVCVVGWTVKRAQSMWIVRNSWGRHQVPTHIPEDKTCVRRGRNECDVEYTEWVGDVAHRGYCYLPMSFVHYSSWHVFSVARTK